MKFGQQLSTHLTPEWRKQYIQYDELKQMLYDAIAKLPEGTKEEERERFGVERVAKHSQHSLQHHRSSG